MHDAVPQISGPRVGSAGMLAPRFGDERSDSTHGAPFARSAPSRLWYKSPLVKLSALRARPPGPGDDPGEGLNARLDDRDGPESPVTARTLLRWVLGRQSTRITVGALAGIAWMGSIAFLPVALGIAVDRIIDDRSAGSVVLVCALLFAVTLAQAVAGVVRHRSAMLLHNRTRWLVERLVTRRVLDPRGGIDAEAGALLSLAASDAKQVGGIADLMCRGSGAVVSFVAVGVGMLLASPLLGALVLFGLPPCLLVLVPLWRPYDRRATEQQQRLAEASAVAADITTGLRVVKGLGSEDGVRRWFAAGTAEVRSTAVALALGSAARGPRSRRPSRLCSSPSRSGWVAGSRSTAACRPGRSSRSPAWRCSSPSRSRPSRRSGTCGPPGWRRRGASRRSSSAHPRSTLAARRPRRAPWSSSAASTTGRCPASS